MTNVQVPLRISMQAKGWYFRVEQTKTKSHQPIKDTNERSISAVCSANPRLSNTATANNAGAIKPWELR
jgi:hypothetical protein